VNASILLRIMPDLRAKYALMVDKQELGELETLNDALAVRDRLKESDVTFEEARAIVRETSAAD
jgi:hypothetical protein